MRGGTSASCCWLAMTSNLAAGWTTSISLRIVDELLVKACFPRWFMTSLRRPLGPRDVRTISVSSWTAWILLSTAIFVRIAREEGYLHLCLEETYSLPTYIRIAMNSGLPWRLQRIWEVLVTWWEKVQECEREGRSPLLFLSYDAQCRISISTGRRQISMSRRETYLGQFHITNNMI